MIRFRDTGLGEHAAYGIYEALPVLVGTDKREVGAQIGVVDLHLLIPLALCEEDKMV